MVAEAIPEQEEITTPASTPEAPESIPEPTTPAVEEDTSGIDAIVSSLDVEPATAETTGSTASSDGTPDALLKDLTPEQIEERGAQRERERLQQASTAAERQRRLDGMNNALPAIKGRVKDALAAEGLQADTVLSILGMFDELHGTHLGLRQFDLEQYRPQIVTEAGAEMQRQVAGLMYQAIKEDLGEPALKGVQGENVKTWADLTKAIAKEARKGYVPASDYTSKKSVKDLLSKYDTALKERGLSLADITGNGGTDLPPPQGGGRSKPDEVLANPNASREERNAAFERKHGFRPE